MNLVAIPAVALLLALLAPRVGDAKDKSSRRMAEPASKDVSALLTRDRERDRRTKAKPLEKETTVRRFAYTKKELRRDLPPGTHMTAPVKRGRIPGAEGAKKMYGLPKLPKYVETIKLEKGQLVRRNKALGGEAGRGEITSPVTISKKQFVKDATLSR